tara:strand:+ start:494 stop:682 length:189 start_codon:yes stop_codon:yes gene_type:complete
MPVYSDAQNSTTNGSTISSTRLSFPVGTSNPASPTVGDAYFNTSTGAFVVYDGSSWLNFQGA